MKGRNKTKFLGQGYVRLDRDEQDYLRDLARSLLDVQRSAGLAVERRGGMAGMAAGGEGPGPESPAAHKTKIGGT